MSIKKKKGNFPKPMLAELMDKEQINRVFDRQIKMDKKFETHKRLFNLTFDFSLDDWKLIRTEMYWQTIDKLPYDAKKKYTLMCVENYLNDYR
jgi:hypothetical protein